MGAWLDDLNWLNDVAGEGPISESTRVQAEQVRGSVERAVLGELDPSGDLALGRYPPFLMPGAAAKILSAKGKYNPNDPEARDVLAHAVRRTIGVGWLMAAGLEPFEEVEPGRSDEDIFTLWASGFTDDPANIVGKEGRKIISEPGQSIFVGQLKEAGMTRFLGGSKVNQLGALYAGAGLLLRYSQSTEVSNDEFYEGVERYRELVAEDVMGRGRWGWASFSVDG